MKKYDEGKVVAHLLHFKSPFVRIDNRTKHKVIEIDKTAGNAVGIHTWGKIDFLVNHCGYIQLFFYPHAKVNPNVKEGANKPQKKTNHNKPNGTPKKAPKAVIAKKNG